MLWLGIDTETTGLDPNEDRVVEIGAVLWDCETKQPVEIYNTLIKTEIAISEEAAEVNGLSNELLDAWGVEESQAMDRLWSMLAKADYCIAHNAPFDKAMLEESFKRCNKAIITPPWLDSAVDVPYPRKIKARSLTLLAAEHGFLNPFPHRAVTDVLAMLKLISSYDPYVITQYNMADTLKLRAMVPKPWLDDGKGVAACKSIGYRFDQVNKMWTKKIKDFQLEEETKLAEDKGFKAILIKEKEDENND